MTQIQVGELILVGLALFFLDPAKQKPSRTGGGRRRWFTSR